MMYTAKIFLISALLIIQQYAAFGQTRPEDLRQPKDIFKNFMGYVDDDGKYRLEGEGYNIVITAHNKLPTPANYKKIAEDAEGHKKVIVKALNNDPLQNYVLDMSL